MPRSRASTTVAGGPILFRVDGTSPSYCQLEDVPPIGQGYNCGEISENPKPCTDRRGRRGSGSQYPSEPYALFHARPRLRVGRVELNCNQGRGHHGNLQLCLP